MGSAFTPASHHRGVHCLDHLKLPGLFFLIFSSSSKLVLIQVLGIWGEKQRTLGMTMAGVPSICYNAISCLGVLFCPVLLFFSFLFSHIGHVSLDSAHVTTL